MDARNFSFDDDEEYVVEQNVLDDDNEILSIRVSEIEQLARKTHSIPESDALYLIHHLRLAMADRVSLISGIARSAELLGDALDTIDIPQRLIDDVTSDGVDDNTRLTDNDIEERR